MLAENICLHNSSDDVLQLFHGERSQLLKQRKRLGVGDNRIAEPLIKVIFIHKSKIMCTGILRKKIYICSCSISFLSSSCLLALILATSSCTGTYTSAMTVHQTFLCFNKHLFSQLIMWFILYLLPSWLEFGLTILKSLIEELEDLF